jgi:uncharacterized membrane protein YdjX (TVP38/TMEM64 family)
MRLLLWFLVLTAAIVASWLAWGGAWERELSPAGAVAWLARSGPWAWAAGIGLLVADVVLPVPATVVMSALGWIYGPILGGAAAAAGSICAGLAGYGLGRLPGARLAARLLGERDFARGQRLFAAGGGWLVALSRALPILPEAISCTAGLVRMPFSRFLAALACGAVPMGFVFAVIGAAGKSAPGSALAFSLIVPALLWAVARRWGKNLR